ncbi:MAG: TonB-dependent receptor [Candidatus Marinimicrobia bacterium]|nr:TonB-dependent receptor [Candidatus Neomarinimicrobiota bacterium]
MRIWLVIGLSLMGLLRGANLSGYVADRETGETIIGVNVIIDGSNYGASTDRNGFFTVTGISVGEYTLRFSHIAYQLVSQKVNVGRSDKFLGTVLLDQAAIQGESITVTANRGKIIKRDMDISGFEVDPVVLREVPTLGRDVFRLVQYSPSTTISDPMSPLYYVRGSDPGENLVQLDGMTIYNPQHMLSLQAIFNPYAIKSIEMLVGGYDAEFGGRNSSILYISSREGHQDEVKGEFKPSTSGFKGAIEFPVSGGGTAMLSGRVLTSLVNRVLMNMPNYMGDFNGAWQKTIGKTKVRVSTFYARDYMDYDFHRFSIYFTQPYMKDYSFGFLSDATNLALGVKTRSILIPSLVAETHCYFSRFSVDNKNFFSFSAYDSINNVDVVLKYTTRIINRISDFTTKANLTYFTVFNQTLKLGVENNQYNFYNDTGIFSNQSSITDLSSALLSFYLQDKIALGALLLKFGIRQARFQSASKWRSEPRASFALKLGNTTIKGAWGRYHQYIATMNTQDVEISQYLDYYYPLIDKVPLTSLHYILSMEGKFIRQLNYSLSAYFKELPVLYRFDYNSSSASIFAYNAGLEQGSGEAYGAEFLVRGNWKRLSGWTSYSWSRSTRNYPSIQAGKSFLFDGDQTHNLKAVLLFKLTDDITASTTIKITSGFPRTWETGNFNHYTYDPLANSVGVFPEPYTPDKNNVRYPARVAWDIGWKKKLRGGFGYYLAEYIGSDEAYFTLSIQNLLFLRRNPYMYVYIPEYGHYGFDIAYFPMVSAGYSIKF